MSDGNLVMTVHIWHKWVFSLPIHSLNTFSLQPFIYLVKAGPLMIELFTRGEINHVGPGFSPSKVPAM